MKATIPVFGGLWLLGWLIEERLFNFSPEPDD
jgi:hypothetical protein